MKATLVFKSHEYLDISIGMTFIPCICWVVGKKTIFKPHTKEPNYLMGDFQGLLKLPLFKDVRSNKEKKLVLIIQPEGHGTQSDIDNLLEDIKKEKFNVRVVNL